MLYIDYILKEVKTCTTFSLTFVGLIKIRSHLRRTAWGELLLFSLCLDIVACLTFDYMGLVSFVHIRSLWVTRQDCHPLQKRQSVVSGELQPLVWDASLPAWEQHAYLCLWIHSYCVTWDNTKTHHSTISKDHLYKSEGSLVSLAQNKVLNVHGWNRSKTKFCQQLCFTAAL